MFYPVESLRRGGRFHLCWVADAWSERFEIIKTRQIFEQDVRKMCDDLLDVIQQESGRPSRRFSLRLSSQLIHGLVLFYRRKVNLFIHEVCMLQAYTMHSINQRTKSPEPKRRVRRSPPVQRLVIQEIDGDERVEELLQQNTQNIVARVEDITLREPNIPDNRALYDGFGEMDLQIPSITLNDQTVEFMLGPEGSAMQQSALELVDLTPENLNNLTHLADRASAHMERISEHDVSVLNKSTGTELRAPGSFGGEITDIPLPEMTIPPETQTMVGEAAQPSASVIDKSPEQITVEEIASSDLDANLRPRRRKVRPRIDECTVMSGTYMGARIKDDHVDLRCKDSTSDVIKIRGPTTQQLLHRPCHAGIQPSTKLNLFPNNMFLRRLNACTMPPVATAVDAPQEALVQDKTRDASRSFVQEMEQPEGVAHAPTNVISEPMEVLPIPETNPGVPVNQEDISDFPTQKISTVATVEEPPREIPSPIKIRRVGVRTFTSAVEMDFNNISTNKENIPDNRQARISVLLQEAGLADVPQEKIDEANHSKSRSETPLGSLDRTKVSLGDSDVTTESQRFLRDEWGSYGTMHKLFFCIKDGLKGINVRALVSRGPTLQGRERLVAAKCFTSLLKLRQHGFITIEKDPVTLEIVNITLGPRLLKLENAEKHL
ncbi:unnamed protein product [Leptosia nina]|uniref:Rad21/Rec8-like protein N-terminal domain-containing protein n=1 Tax=Leptosia nina TaxID=320188 RepID=A0AAV1JM83_9NEOP